jgi:hypothetical protein
MTWLPVPFGPATAAARYVLMAAIEAVIFTSLRT